jgi:osmotically-inducible protein OsmY
VTFSATSRDTNAPSRIYSPDTTSASTPNELKAPDNTGKNVRDRNDNTLTPGDQGTSDSDRDITRQIRRALTSDDSLSTTAKNIKIITVNGKVTLRGPVKSEQEQKAIADAAQKVAGQASIDNQLEVKTTNQ